MDATPIIAREGKDRKEGEGVVTETAPMVFEVPSFSEEGKTYAVDLGALSCSCPRFEVRGDCAKHVSLAQAIRRARARRCHSRSVEEELFRLCRRLYAPKRVLRRETAAGALAFACEVEAYPHSTSTMRAKARSRHARLLALGETSGKRAA